jgi:hypothetical protein
METKQPSGKESLPSACHHAENTKLVASVQFPFFHFLHKYLHRAASVSPDRVFTNSLTDYRQNISVTGLRVLQERSSLKNVRPSPYLTFFSLRAEIIINYIFWSVIMFIHRNHVDKNLKRGQVITSSR